MSTPSPGSAFDHLGPHLLGRVPSPRDARDWQMQDFLLPPADDSLLGKTVQQILDEGTYFSSWPGILIFWQWAKHNQPAPPQSPAPASATSGATRSGLGIHLGGQDPARPRPNQPLRRFWLGGLGRLRTGRGHLPGRGRQRDLLPMQGRRRAAGSGEWLLRPLRGQGDAKPWSDGRVRVRLND
jgi:hypothetical protein